MVKVAVFLTVVALLATSAFADVYMHNPRGSNNRLNEATAERTNANRLFDSQNNNRGGYNVGDKTAAAFNGNNPISTTYMDPDDNTASQYPLVYYEKSILSMEWTNQHGCGGRESDDPHKLNCNIVLQYMCDTAATQTDPAMSVNLRDGGNTNTPDEPGNTADAASIANTATNNDNNRRGRHENEYYYYECKNRNRNKGLFLADQNLNGNSAKYTRQNPNGGRSGLECPEERDYYPYWSPSPWRDIAVLTDTTSRCNIFESGSLNVATLGKCTDAAFTPAKIAPITPTACTTAGGTWKTFTHGLEKPECLLGQWSRDNHLGNGRFGYPNMYNWTLPSIQTLTNTQVKMYNDFGYAFARCVVRLRYNISTDDYDPYNTNATYNKNAATGVRSPVENNPVVDVGAKFQGLRLAINTNQFGRTFQDRSHVFLIRARPPNFATQTIYNLNVRGKRGNIVQTFPSVEYDFQPQRLHVRRGDLIHVQWTGSNTHNNGNPAGDGQAGDAGEGTGGTDRNNMVPTRSPGDNFPLPLDKSVNDQYNFLKYVDCFNYNAGAISSTDCALSLATSGYYRTAASIKTKDALNELLNNAPASYVQGMVLSFKSTTPTTATSPTAYSFICTRNNNFTNRSQKGVIIVSP